MVSSPGNLICTIVQVPTGRRLLKTVRRLNMLLVQCLSFDTMYMIMIKGMLKIMIIKTTVVIRELPVQLYVQHQGVWYLSFE